MNHARHDRNTAHTIHRHQQHLSWDNARLPAITIAPGDCVEFQDLDAMGGQLTAQSTVGELSMLDPNVVNPIAGPVYVDGAEPGDTLKVTLLGLALARSRRTRPAAIWTFATLARALSCICRSK
jgi:acetamidase/formamidase